MPDVQPAPHLLTVKKEGSTKGRAFLRCNHHCKSFKRWATDADRRRKRARRPRRTSRAWPRRWMRSATDAHSADVSARPCVVPFREPVLASALLTHVPASDARGRLDAYLEATPPTAQARRAARHAELVDVRGESARR